MQTTSWSVIREAARGVDRARDDFVNRYRPAIVEYLRARWAGTRRARWVEDAVQDVLLECLRSDGVLTRCVEARPDCFRAFLLGATRNVALRYETGRGCESREAPITAADLDDVVGPADRASRAFEQAWAHAVVQEAAQRMVARNKMLGAAALRRVEMLRLRFFEGLPIRAIAHRWSLPGAILHREYARARDEFRAALLEVLESHHPGRPDQAREDAVRLADILASAASSSGICR